MWTAAMAARMDTVQQGFQAQSQQEVFFSFQLDVKNKLKQIPST